MRLVVSFCLLLCPALAATLSLYGNCDVARAADIPAEHDPWRRFEPGAWKKVRVIQENFDKEGVVSSRSTIDRTTTLLLVEDDGATLEHEATHEVGPITFPRDPETVKTSFHGVPVSDDLKIDEAGEGEVTIEERKIPCRILELEYAGPTSKTVTKVYYSSSVAPYVLRQESVTTDPEGNNSRTDETIAVVALDMPWKFQGQVLKTAHVKTVLKHPKGTTTTLALTSPEVPGGVVWNSSKELDTTGRLIRWSTLELVGYGMELPQERTGLFGRRRQGLFRRTTPLLQPP